MKAHRIFAKGDYVYCLLSSFTHPNILFPVKAIVIDTMWDRVNPLYKIRILKFYDNFNFIKRYFFDMNFRYDFENRARKFPLKAEDFNNRDQLTERLNETDRDRFCVIVESVMCTKAKTNMQDLFKRIQFYMISKNLKEIREMSTRTFFKSQFSCDSAAEFNIRLKRAWGDKFEGTDINIDKYLESLD